MSAITESLAIGNELLNVRYRGASAEALKARCDAWFEAHKEWHVRDEFAGSRMLVSQLDLFSAASDRVRNVRLNCEYILNNKAA